MSLELTIKPAYIKYSEEKMGDLTLMEHQKETKHCEDKLVILDAPTASGKTLAMLTRFIKSQGNGVMLYPTNELIKDQGKGIKELFDKIGIKSAVVPVEGGLELDEEDVDVVIAFVTGDSLEGIARTKGKAIQNILRLVDGEKRLLLLTNVDTLHLLFKMKYWRGRTLLSEFLSLNFSLLAVDELHLYSGVSFANLFYLICLLRKRFDQIIVSSATLHDSIGLFKEMFKNHREIRPEIYSTPEGKARQIRHDLALTILPVDYILSEDDSEKIIQYVDQLYDPNRVETTVDTLIIVNSVVFSERLSDQLRKIYNHDEIGVISGFIPDGLRKQRPLTIGTSAVEVGVDFDVNNLIFEGTNAGSFIQRLGRCGRHRAGESIGFIPTSAYRKLKRKDIEENLSMQDLDKYSKETIPQLESYSNFAKSVYGSALFTSLLYPTIERKNPSEIKKAWDELKLELFEAISWDDLYEIISKKVLEIMSEGGARGDILTIPVFLEKYRAYSRMDILEVPRTVFHFERVENIDASKPPWLKAEEIVVIKEYGGKTRVKGTWSGPLLNKNTRKILYTRTEGKNTTLSLQLGNEKVEKMAEKLFHEKIAHPTSTFDLSDWRFPRIYNSQYREQCLVIGLDALVQKYVEECG